MCGPKVGSWRLPPPGGRLLLVSQAYLGEM